jgi:hypothetical protein
MEARAQQGVAGKERANMSLGQIESEVMAQAQQHMTWARARGGVGLVACGRTRVRLATTVTPGSKSVLGRAGAAPEGPSGGTTGHNSSGRKGLSVGDRRTKWRRQLNTC